MLASPASDAGGTGPRAGAPTDVALFLPCYVDLFAADVGFATVEVLERAGCRVEVDLDQTCCGQPFLNAGAVGPARRLAQRHLRRFAGAEAIVAPSASCVATVRHRFPEVAEEAAAEHGEQRAATFELGEFLVRVLGRTDLGARFPHKVALLQSCHGLRDLGLGRGGEEGPDAPPRESPAIALLRCVEGLELVLPERPGECCGFGGTFAVKLPEISTRMGRERLEDLAASGAEFVTSTDVSCLLHLEGLRRRTGVGPRAIHLAEILASRVPA